MLATPGLGLIAEQELRDFRASAENALRKQIGNPISSVPNDLTSLPGVKQPDSPDDLVFGADGSGNTLIGQAVAGIADVATHGAVLVGIVILVLMGARMALGNDGTPDLGKLMGVLRAKPA